MVRPPRRGGAAPDIDMAGIPAATYSFNAATIGQPAVTFYMNGETVDFIPMMPSHTAGDTIVRFRKADVIYIEDFYRNFGYPFADQANGGSLRECSRPPISSPSWPVQGRPWYPVTAR